MEIGTFLAFNYEGFLEAMPGAQRFTCERAAACWELRGKVPSARKSMRCPALCAACACAPLGLPTVF